MLKDLPTQIDLNAYLKNIKEYLVTLLTPELGKYQLFSTNGSIISEVDAIAIEPPPFKNNIRKFKKDSGMECIINRTGCATIRHLLGANEYYVDYKIKLIQYDYNKSTQNAVAKILNSNRFFIVKDPVIVQFQETPDLYIYESASISIRTFMVHNNEYI